MHTHAKRSHTHIRDHTVHIRVQWILGTQKEPACTKSIEVGPYTEEGAYRDYSLLAPSWTPT